MNKSIKTIAYAVAGVIGLFSLVTVAAWVLSHLTLCVAVTGIVCLAVCMWYDLA